MTRIKKLAFAALVALALTGGAAGTTITYDDVARKVNEYEGQHRVAGQDPEFPVTPNFLAGKDPEMPVSPNFLAGKDPEFPVTPNQA